MIYIPKDVCGFANSCRLVQLGALYYWGEGIERERCKVWGIDRNRNVCLDLAWTMSFSRN